MQYLNHQCLLENGTQKSDWDVRTNQLCLLQYFSLSISSYCYSQYKSTSDSNQEWLCNTDQQSATCQYQQSQEQQHELPKVEKNPQQFQGNTFSDDPILIQQSLYLVYLLMVTGVLLSLFNSNHLRSGLLLETVTSYQFFDTPGEGESRRETSWNHAYSPTHECRKRNTYSEWNSLWFVWLSSSVKYNCSINHKNIPADVSWTAKQYWQPQGKKKQEAIKAKSMSRIMKPFTFHWNHLLFTELLL